MTDAAPNDRRTPAHLRDSWQPGAGYADSWGPYYAAFFPPRRVTSWVYWKRMTTGVNVVRRLWDQREALRELYESYYGPHPAHWPEQHPGVVLDAVQWAAHAACLRCPWIDRPGVSMRDDGWRDEAQARASRHEAPR